MVKVHKKDNKTMPNFSRVSTLDFEWENVSGEV